MFVIILAEFIIDLAQNHSTFDDFKKSLIENGAEFPDSFITNLLRIIQLMKPSKNSNSNVYISTSSSNNKLVEKFPGLAIPNRPQLPPLSDDDSENDNGVSDDDDDKKKNKINKKDIKLKSVADDMMAELESFAPSLSNETEKKEEKSISIKKREGSNERSTKRSKSRESKRNVRDNSKDRNNRRHRSRSKDRRDRYHRSRSRDKYDRHRRSRSRDRRDRAHRSRSRDRRDRDVDHRNGGSTTDRHDRSREHKRDSGNSRSRDRNRRSRSRDGYNRSRSRDRYNRSRSRDKNRRQPQKSPEKSRTKGSPTPSVSEEPEPGRIYTGRVANIVAFGCFVQVVTEKKRWEGLVHISQLRAEGRVTDVTEVVQKNATVKVKVMSITGQKVSLSMKEVDQNNGKDLNPGSHAHLKGDNDLRDRNPDRPVGGTSMLHLQGNIDDEEDQSRKRVTRISSPERWEIKQMISSGVIDRSELPDFDEETGLIHKDEDDEADIEIEIVEEEPPFLQGHGRALHDLSPVRIVKNPDGSLAQAAMMQSALAKERRELKMLQREQEMDTIPTSLNKNWIDPLPEGML